MIAGHLAVYPGRVDACCIDDDRVTPRDSTFDGGWLMCDVALDRHSASKSKV